MSDERLPDHCGDEEGMNAPTDSTIIHVAARGLSPVILIFGLYVYFHGHYSPGGGFQGGVLMAAAILLLRLTLGSRRSQTIMPKKKTLLLGAVGGLLFAGTGLLAMIAGGNFLDYGHLTFGVLTPEYARYYSILFIELGVTVTVMTTLVAIYDELLGC